MKTILRKFTLVIIIALNSLCIVKSQTTEIYGLTLSGGEYKAGQIFKTDGNGDNFKSVFSFFAIDGRGPESLCKSRNGKIYGLTRGIKYYDLRPEDFGSIFEWDPVTNIYTKKFDFDGKENGKFPLGALIEAKNGKLYGMTFQGGLYDNGILYEWDPLTDHFTKKLDFKEEYNPSGSLLEASYGKMYGVLPGGGKNWRGVLFEWDPNTNIFIKKFEFGLGELGNNPTGNLIQATNGQIYGMTHAGGAFDKGVIFEWNPVTDTYTKKFDFDGKNGMYPLGSLIQAKNGKLYGTTQSGGLNVAYNSEDGPIKAGVLFEFDPATNVFKKKLDFSRETGCFPLGRLIKANDNKLLGLTKWGVNDNNGGVIFEWDISSEIYSIKYKGSEEYPAPYFLLAAGHNKYYGLRGGAEGYGEIIEWIFSTDKFSTKIEFDKADNGKCPVGNMVLADNGKLYGMTEYGGANNKGVIFEWDPVKLTFQKKLDFNGLGNGSNPKGSLLKASNGKLYGMTHMGGINNNGVLFEWDPILNILIKILDFKKLESGSLPTGNLIQAEDGKLYGMTPYGGVYNVGVLFEWDIETERFIKLFDFDGSDLGSMPFGSLIHAENGKIYGITDSGGPMGYLGYGVLLEFDPKSKVFSAYDIYGSSNPNGALVQGNDGKLFGLSFRGGANNSGYLFEWDTHTNTFTVRTEFNWTYSTHATGTLLDAQNGKFYGMASSPHEKGLNIMYEWNPVSNAYTTKVDFKRDVPPSSLVEITKKNIEYLNLALNKSVRQSSTKSGGVPENAIDGNTDGNWNNGSVTLTRVEKNAWWEIDLGANYDISAVVLWNRTNSCCIKNLSDFYLLASDEPFKYKKLKQTLKQKDVWYTYSSDYPNPTYTFQINRTARYIRIQLQGKGELSLAEVIVLGSISKSETSIQPKVSDNNSKVGKHNHVDIEEPVFYLYPNPNSGILHVQCTRNISNIEIINMLGKVVVSKKCNQSNIEVNTENLSQGLYYVRIRTIDGNVKNYPIVKK